MSKAKRRKQQNRRREYATKCCWCDGWGIHYQTSAGECIAFPNKDLVSP